MAEEQVIKMAENLVLSNFSEKLRNMQLNNLTAKQQDRLLKTKIYFVELFIELSYSFFGLSQSQLEEFSINELGALDKLIYRKAWPWTIGKMLLTFGVPIFGWILGPLAFRKRDFKSWDYLWARKYLQKVYGEDFYPECLNMCLK